jgi:hypothetical protein
VARLKSEEAHFPYDLKNANGGRRYLGGRVVPYDSKKHGKDDVKTIKRGKKFGYNPDQERDENGRWTSDGASEKMQDLLDRDLDAVLTKFGPDRHSIKDEIMDTVSEKKLSPIKMGPDARIALRQALEGIKRSNKDVGVTSKERGEAGRLLSWLDKVENKKDMTAADARRARLEIASSRERVNFAVIDHNQHVYTSRLSSEWSKIVAQGVKQLLGTDEDVKKLTDTDTSDIAMIEFSGVTKGRLKKSGAMSLREAWVLGKTHAESEIRKAGKKHMKRDPH